MRTIFHHLRSETGRWRVLKKEWEEITYIFCKKGVVKIEKHFIFECAMYEDTCIQLENNLKVGNLNEIFEEARFHKTTSFLITTHNKRPKIEKNLKTC